MRFCGAQDPFPMAEFMCYRIAGSGINEILSIPIASTSVRERARFSALTVSFSSRLSIFSILIDQRDTINNRPINLATWHGRIRSSERRAIAPTFPTNRANRRAAFSEIQTRATRPQEKRDVKSLLRDFDRDRIRDAGCSIKSAV